MPGHPLRGKLRRAWNWLRGKRIRVTDPVRGRVMIRTGHNSAERRNGCQWYVQRYEVAKGVPPLPVCARGYLRKPVTMFQVERCGGVELSRAKRWYERRHGRLRAGEDLVLACVYDPDASTARSRIMHYRPNEIFEIEHPWLSSERGGPSFATYFGTWYGSGMLEEDAVMDWEVVCELEPGLNILPRWGASW